MKRGALLAVLALAACPASAAAHRAHAARSYGPSLLTRALASAEDHAHALWGAVPCGGRFTLEVTALPFGIAGSTRWNSPAGFSWEAPASTWTECTMQLSAEDWTPEGIETDWPLLCTVVMHEWGHLTGHSHSDEAVPGAPGTAPETQEQSDVMRSGRGSWGEDLHRCGWEPR